MDAERRALRTREARLRRAAQRQRAELVKSRRRDPHAWDFGLYWLIDPAAGEVIGAAGSPGMAGDYPGLSLDDVEEWLTREQTTEREDGP